MTPEWEQAIRSGNLDRLRQLQADGADVDSLDIRGNGAPGFQEKTALDLARARQRDDLVAALTVNTDRSEE